MSDTRSARHPALAVMLVAAAVCLAACAPAGGGGADAAETRPVTVRLTADVNTFDPALGRGIDDYYIARLLYDTVLRRDGDELVGGLATEWEAESASEYTLTIRDDATCADGAKITADTVADSLARLADPESTASQWKTLIFGRGDVTVIAEGDSTVRISLSEPFSELFAGLSVAQASIVCDAANAAALDRGALVSAGSGPYTLTESRAGIGYTFALREDYAAWPAYTESEGIPVRTIDAVVLQDESTAANQMLSGDLDLSVFNLTNAQRFEGRDGYTALEYTAGASYLMFNHRDGRVFADAGARQAVAHSFDRAGFNNAYSDGRAPLLLSTVPDWVEFGNEDESLLEEHDPEAAAAVLSGMRFTFLATKSFGNGGAGAEYLYEAFRQAGAEVDFQLVDNATWSSRQSTPDGDWDVVLASESNAVGTINSSLIRLIGVPLEEGGQNRGAGVNEAAETALDRALSASSPEEKNEAYQSAQEALLSQHTVVPLAATQTSLVTTGDLTVRVVNGNIDFASIRIVG